eukprot:5091072-Amphidinium_carterae.1
MSILVIARNVLNCDCPSDREMERTSRALLRLCSEVSQTSLLQNVLAGNWCTLRNCTKHFILKVTFEAKIASQSAEPLQKKVDAGLL